MEEFNTPEGEIHKRTHFIASQLKGMLCSCIISYWWLHFRNNTRSVIVLESVLRETADQRWQEELSGYESFHHHKSPWSDFSGCGQFASALLNRFESTFELTARLNLTVFFFTQSANLTTPRKSKTHFTVFLDCFDLLKETGIHSVFIITVSAEHKTPLANVLTLSHWVDTFSPPFCRTLNLDVIQTVHTPLF